VKIRVEDAHLVDELVHHLRRSGCVAAACDVQENGGGTTLEVEVPAALDARQARMELEVYLKVFEATHPGNAADLIS
jgi:hypothetical protein